MDHLTDFNQVWYDVLCLLSSASTGISYTQLSEDEVNTVLGHVNKKMEASQEVLEALKVQLEKEEQELQNKIDGYR